MAKTFRAAAAACTIGVVLLAATPARAFDPWTAALFWIGGAYVGSLYGMPYPYAGMYRQPYAYMPPAYGYPPAYAGPAPASYAAPPPPRANDARDPKSPDRCMPATMMIDGAQREVRLCY
jgi:hypothetical protein